MSFNKFAVLSVELKLFTDESQNKFLDIRDDSEVEGRFGELKRDWLYKKLEIVSRINGLKDMIQEEEY